MENIALWMSQPHHGYLEIARTLGVKSLVLELEHGTFDLSTLDQFWRHQGAGHAGSQDPRAERRVHPAGARLRFRRRDRAASAGRGARPRRDARRQVPLLGVRSYTSGRVFGYARPASDAFDRENARSKCYAMIETAESLADVERIIALDTVDGLFPARPTWRWRVGAVPMHSTTRTGPICGASPRPRATRQALGHARLDRSRTPVRAGGGRVPAGDRDTDDDRAGIASLIDAVRRKASPLEPPHRSDRRTAMKVSLVQTNPQPDRARNLDETRPDGRGVSRGRSGSHRIAGILRGLRPQRRRKAGHGRAGWRRLPDGQRLRPRAPRVRPCRHHHGKGRERGAYLEHVLRVRSIGREVAAYRKIHMFDIVAPDGSVYRESDSVKPGGRS